MIETTHVAARIRGALPDVTEAEVAEALAGIDVAAVEASVAGQLTARVWDRVEHINGVEASVFLARDDVPDEGDVLLIEKDGSLVLFQPHDPQGGAIPVGAGAAVGAAILSQLDHSAAVDALGPQALRAITEARALKRGEVTRDLTDQQAQIDFLTDRLMEQELL